MRFGGRQLGRALAIAGALLVLSATPALADPPGPTNYRTQIVGIEPATAGLSAEILGGDSFLRLITSGLEVVVPGYDGDELYLRFEADGRVLENRRSRTYFQNQARYSVLERDLPSDLGAEVPPDWVEVSTDGTYAWHDHRIHWMSPTTLPFAATTDGEARQVVNAGGEQLTTVFSEPIVIRVDGNDVNLLGELYYVPDASPVAAVIGGLLGLVAVAGLGLSRPAGAVALGVVVPGAFGLALGIPQVVGLAPGVTSQPTTVIIPAIAVMVGLAGWATRGRSAAMLVGAAGVVPLLAWVLLSTEALTAPIVPPTGVPSDLTRLALGLAVGGGVGAAITAVRRLLVGPEVSPRGPAG